MKRDINDSYTLLWINRVVGKLKINIGILVVLQMVLGISSVGTAMLLREIVNAAVEGEEKRFGLAVFAFILLTAGQIILRAAGRFFDESTRSSMENRLKKRLFSVLLTHDYAAVTRIHSGEWMNRLTSDAVIVANHITDILPNLAGMLIRLAGALIAILYLEPKFLYFLLPGGIALVFLTYAFRKVLKKLHKKIQETDGILRTFLSERLSSLMIVRTFAKEEQTACQAEALMEDHKAARMKRNHFSNFCNIGFSSAMNGIYVLGAVFCGYGILTKSMSYGNFMAILQLIGQVQSPFANITGILPRYYAMLASAERLMEAEAFGREAEKVKSEKECTDFYNNEFNGMGLKQATFTYQPPVQKEEGCERMPVVLHNLNLEINKGEYVVFTGTSGCGKSTVLKLLMCLYELDEGERYLITPSGQQPLNPSWRSLFAYVPQGNQLLSGSIREIIAFGDRERMHQEEKMHQALMIACAEEFVSELENGLDTVLGERGTGLSEGQMQRIAIARAVFSDRPILLLDEATSSLDEQTEMELLDHLRSMTDKTVVLVTHRAAVLKICDKEIQFGEEINERRRDSV